MHQTGVLEREGKEERKWSTWASCLPFGPGLPSVPLTPGTPSVPLTPGTPSVPLVPGLPRDVQWKDVENTTRVTIECLEGEAA